VFSVRQGQNFQIFLNEFRASDDLRTRSSVRLASVVTYVAVCTLQFYSFEHEHSATYILRTFHHKLESKGGYVYRETPWISVVPYEPTFPSIETASIQVDSIGF
jgi:hypothetical protein